MDEEIIDAVRSLINTSKAKLDLIINKMINLGYLSNKYILVKMESLLLNILAYTSNKNTQQIQDSIQILYSIKKLMYNIVIFILFHINNDYFLQNTMYNKYQYICEFIDLINKLTDLINNLNNRNSVFYKSNIILSNCQENYKEIDSNKHEDSKFYKESDELIALIKDLIDNINKSITNLSLPIASSSLSRSKSLSLSSRSKSSSRRKSSLSLSRRKSLSLPLNNNTCCENQEKYANFIEIIKNALDDYYTIVADSKYIKINKTFMLLSKLKKI